MQLDELLPANHRQTLHGLRQSVGTTLARLAGVGVICLGVGIGGGAVLADDHEEEVEGEEFSEEDEFHEIDENYDIEEDGDTVYIDEYEGEELEELREAEDRGEDYDGDDSKRKARHAYKTERDFSEDRFNLTLDQEGEDGEQVTFFYDEEEDSILVTVDETELEIGFAEDDVVFIGDVECSDEDYKCISKEVSEVLSELEPEDIAAVEAALKSQFNEMEQGYDIQYVLNLMSAELAGQAPK